MARPFLVALTLAALALTLPQAHAGPVFERFGFVGPGAMGVGDADVLTVTVEEGATVNITLQWAAPAGALAVRVIGPGTPCPADLQCLPALDEGPCDGFFADAHDGSMAVDFVARRAGDYEVHVLPMRADRAIAYALHAHVSILGATIDGPHRLLAADAGALTCA